MKGQTSLPVKPGETLVRRWTPLRGLAELQTEFDRLFEETGPLMSLWRRPETPEFWTPRVDIYSLHGTLHVKVEVPGVPKEGIEVYFEEGDLVIRGERKVEEKVEEKEYYRLERVFGRFYRRLPLPEGVKPEEIKAIFKDGVLEIEIPEVPVPEVKPIKVAVK
jgi:HSP20 family protein